MNYDKDKIVAAIRKYNRANVAMMKAHEELMDALPEGLVVFHRRPGEPIDTISWTYEKRKGEIYRGVGHGEGGALLIEAPAPLDEEVA